MKKFVNFKFVVMFALALVANVASLCTGQCD